MHKYIGITRKVFYRNNSVTRNMINESLQVSTEEILLNLFDT